MVEESREENLSLKHVSRVHLSFLEDPQEKPLSPEWLCVMEPQEATWILEITKEWPRRA